MKNLPSWGKHLVVDAAGCTEAINDKAAIEAFIKQLVVDIDMKAYGEPDIEWFAEHDPTKAGFTLVQLIETSAVVCHFVPATMTLHFDAFSCKDFDSETVVALLRHHFGIKAWNQKEFSREAPDLNS
jgi:S-adenosylmethionine/arginine decarboxylase-like enzyme